MKTIFEEGKEVPIIHSSDVVVLGVNPTVVNVKGLQETLGAQEVVL